MIDLEKIKLELRTNKVLKSNLDLLINICINQQTLTFQEIGDEIDIELLIKEKVIIRNSNNYTVNENLFFAYLFYQKYSEILDFSVGIDFHDSVRFLKNIEVSFRGETTVQGYFRLERKLWAFAILDSNKKCNSDFFDYLSSLKKETDRKECFAFNEGYSFVLPFLEIEIDIFYKNLQLLLGWMVSDAYYNMPLGVLLNGIRNKIFKDDKFGIQLFKYSIRQEIIENNILIPIISGLYNKLGIIFFERKINPLLKNDKFSVSIICGLSNIENIEEKDANSIIQVYDKFNLNKEEVLINIPKLLFSVLKSKAVISKPGIKTKCFNRLKKLITNDNSNLISFILHELQFLDKFNQNKTSLIIKLIEQPHFKTDKYLKQVSDVLWNLKDIKCFEKILLTLADRFPFSAIAEFLSTSIDEFKNNNTLPFEKILINLLIHDKAKYRFLGAEIFNDISRHSFQFAVDILSLSPINQYKLWVSICQSNREPEYVIPCLLPLTNSKSPVVKESFICKLEVYSESYGGAVTSTLKKFLDLKDQQSNDVFVRVNNYRKYYFEKYIKVKHGIKELNPYYTQNKLFIEYSKNRSRVFSRDMKKNMAEHDGIFQIFPKVMLAKGGGWKTEGSESISKLSNVKSTFSLPRDYFINPENYDFEWSNNINQDWGDNFIELENVLANE